MKVRLLPIACLMVGLLVAGLGFFWLHAKRQKDTCRMIVQNVQVAMRSYQGMNNLPVGAPLDRSAIIGPGRFIETEIKCPAGGSCEWSPVVPPVGGLMIRCTHPDHQLDPAETKDW